MADRRAYLSIISVVVVFPVSSIHISHLIHKKGALQNLKYLLQLDHELPVGLQEVVAEVILARVDGLSRNLKRRKTKDFWYYLFTM